MPELEVASGVAAWESAGWRVEALAWLDDRLAAAGVARLGDVEQPRVRPWATVLRAPTTVGTVWLKASAPETAYEVGIYDVLGAVVPDRVLTPIATDAGRGWMILPDGGPPLAERGDARAQVSGLTDALTRYGQLQRDVAGAVDRLLAAGAPDMRPALMLQRFDEAVDVTARFVDAHGSADDRTRLERVAAARVTVAGWCEQLVASGLPPSLDHNDLHPANVLGNDGDTRFYDWGDAVVAHPFAALLVPLRIVAHLLECEVDDDRVAAVRDAYLAGFATASPHEDLVATLNVAVRLANVARALTWERAVSAARAQGVAIDDEWARAALETLLAVLDPASS